MVPLLERRNHDAVVVANAEAWTACILVLAHDAEKLPCSVQEDCSTCLLWSGWQTHVAQQVPGAMLRSDVPHSLLELQSVTKRSQNASCARCGSSGTTLMQSTGAQSVPIGLGPFAKELKHRACISEVVFKESRNRDLDRQMCGIKD